MTVHRAVARYQTRDDASALILQHASMIDRAARRLVQRTGASSAYDDLWSAGAMGLVDAQRRYNPDKGVRFETFAEHRVRGAMLDELRRLDRLPRRIRDFADEIARARRELSQVRGCEPTDDDVAAHLGVTTCELMEAEVSTAVPTSLTEHLEPAAPQSLEAALLRRCDSAALAEAIAALPERLRMVLSLRYVEDLTLREIAAMMKVSEPRICQLHGDAVARMRSHLGLVDRPKADASDGR